MFGLNKRGWTWDFLQGTFSIIIGAVLIVVFLSATVDNSILGKIKTTVFGDNGPLKVVQEIASGLARGIFTLVAPAIGPGVDENTQYIALGLFLLVWVVGSYSLSNVGFFGPLSAFFVSGLVAMVGARSLTKEILERSNLAAGPLTAVLIIFAAFPIIMVKGMMDKIYGRKDVAFYFKSKKDPKRLKSFVWKNGLGRIVIWALLAYIYYFVVEHVIMASTGDAGALRLSTVYGFCALLFGIFDTFKYVQRRSNPDKASEDLGKLVAQIRAELNELKAVGKGAKNEAAEALGAGKMGVGHYGE